MFRPASGSTCTSNGDFVQVVEHQAKRTFVPPVCMWHSCHADLSFMWSFPRPSDRTCKPQCWDPKSLHAQQPNSVRSDLSPLTPSFLTPSLPAFIRRTMTLFFRCQEPGSLWNSSSGAWSDKCIWLNEYRVRPGSSCLTKNAVIRNIGLKSPLMAWVLGIYHLCCQVEGLTLLMMLHGGRGIH